MKLYNKLFPLAILLLVFLFSDCKKEKMDTPDPNPNPIDSMNLVVAPLSSFTIDPAIAGTAYGTPTKIFMADDDNPILLSSNGIFRSEDNGKNWSPVKYKPNNFLSQIVKTSDGSFYAMFKDDGFFKSTDNGKTWVEQNISNIDFAIPFNKYKLVVATDGDLFFLQFRHFTEVPRLFHSTDGGNTFLQINTLPDFGGNYNVMEFEAGGNGSILLATEGGFFKLENDAQNWTQIADFTDVRDLFITPDGLAFFRRAMTSVTLRGMDDGSNWETMAIYGNVIGYNVDGHLVLSGWLNDNENVFRSTDNGVTWLAYGFQEYHLEGIASNSAVNLSVAFGKIYFNYPWDVVWGSFQLPDGAIRDLIFHDGKWIVATPKSVHLSDDDGKTWGRSYHFNPDQFDSANRLAIRKNDDKIMVGSLNGDAKIYVLDENVTVVEEVISFNTFAAVTGLTQDEEGRTMVALGDHDGNGISFFQTGWGNTWVEQKLPPPTPYAYFHDIYYNKNGIAYASFEHEFGKTGIAYFLMHQTVGGASTGEWAIENSYQTNHMILKTFTRKDHPTLFIAVDNVDRLWFSRGGKWELHGDTNIGEVHKIRFDDSGYLYLMTEQGVFKTSVVLE